MRRLTSDGRILVVDDDADARLLLADILAVERYEIDTAGNGELALCQAVLQPPDLIVLDVRMPGLDGLEACRCLKQHPRTAGIPVIFLSAATDLKDKIVGFDAGAADYIGKPFVDVDVLARIKTHMDMTLIAKDILGLRRNEKRARGVGGPQATTPALAAKEILIVEDAPESMRLLAQMLTDAGYVVREAPNGELALWSVRLREPDLILLDIRMPGMNGIDVCFCLKIDPATNPIPVMFITAATDPRDKEEGFAAGGIDFIGKPFVADEVLARVKAHLRLADEMRCSAGGSDVPELISGSGIGEVAHAFALSKKAVLLFDSMRRVAFANAVFAGLTGYTLPDVHGLPAHDLFDDDAFLSRADALGHWSGMASVKTQVGAPLRCTATISRLTNANAETRRALQYIAVLTPTD